MRSNSLAAALRTAAVLASLLVTIVAAPSGAPAAMSHPLISLDRSGGPIVPFTGKLFDGRSVSVDRKGVARIGVTVGRKLLSQRVMLTPAQQRAFRAGGGAFERQKALFQVAQPLPSAYAPHTVLVVFKDGTTIPSDSFAVPAATLRALRAPLSAVRSLGAVVAPNYTTDTRANAAFAQLGVSRTERLFGRIPRGTLASASARAAARTQRPVLNLGNVFRLHITNATLPAALRALSKLPNVAYAGREFRASSMNSGAVAVPAAEAREARSLRPRRAFGRATQTTRIGRSILSLPTTNPALDNFTVATNAQSFLNAPGVDAIAAFDELAQKFPGQLPGAGVTITNITLADADDVSASTNPTDPCNALVTQFGPTTRMIGSQRYLDLPSMPLIPTYVADGAGDLSGSAEACGMDPFLEEAALDFSVMAPLPHAQQRPGETGDGLSDLLGIAPGASYRMVVPVSPALPDILGAVIGAATQSPAPDIITMSVGFALDRFGFPGRYFDDDPLARSVVSTVVNTYNIPFFISANDGTRAGIGAPIGPSGGAAPTTLVPQGAPSTTTLNDIGLTTAGSAIPDSGSIDVGGTTLDDVMSANPQDPANAALSSTHAFPETRFNGFLLFASGFGSRVNVSAPSDNIDALVRSGPSFDSILPTFNGGTSAAAPEAAAVGAIALQVARLEGRPFTSSGALRDFLAATGTPVAQSNVTDIALNVGPQVSARRVVERLLDDAHAAAAPGVGRVAVTQRRVACEEVGDCAGMVLLEYVDPAIISLRQPIGPDGQFTGSRTNDYLTLAPDWENLPPNAQFKLTVAGRPGAVLATTPFARLLPAKILAAAGMSLASPSARTVTLTYQSTVGLHVVAQTTFDLTFGPADGTSTTVLPVVVPPVVTGSTIPVTYDASALPSRFGLPYLVVLYKDRIVDGFSKLAFDQQVTSLKGTLSVPVSGLDGAGVYEISLFYGGPSPLTTPSGTSMPSFTRVTTGSARPSPPLLGTSLSPPGHSLEVPYAQPITIGWNVANVPNATGAMLEVGFGAPNLFGNFNIWNNPNGGGLDADGTDTGSVFHQALPGVSGTITIDPRKLGVLPGAFQPLRVLATNGSNVIGEASDTSAFEMDGVAPPDGGTVFANAVNTGGNDGLLTSIQAGCITINGINDEIGQQFGAGPSPGTLIASAVMTYDQTTLQILNPNVVSSASCDSQPMIFANDTGFFYDRGVRAFAAVPNVSAPAPAIQYLPFPAGAIPNDLTFGPGVPNFATPESVVFATGQEYVDGGPANTTAAFFGLSIFGSGAVNQGTAFAVNLDNQTASPVMPIDDFRSFGVPTVLGQAYDPTRNIAYYAIADALNGDPPATILAIDFTNGTHRIFSTTGLGEGNGAEGLTFLALDATTQKMLFVTDSGNGLVSGNSVITRPLQFHLIDMQTGAVSIVQPLQYTPFGDITQVLADPVNHLFIVIERDRNQTDDDLTRPSAIDFFDEAGNLVKHIVVPYAMLPYWDTDGPQTSITYVNGRTRRLFVPAPLDVAGVYEPQLMAIDY